MSFAKSLYTEDLLATYASSLIQPAFFQGHVMLLAQGSQHTFHFWSHRTVGLVSALALILCIGRSCCVFYYSAYAKVCTEIFSLLSPWISTGSDCGLQLLACIKWW